MSLADLSLGNTITYGVVQPGADDPHGVPMIRVNNFTANGLDLSNLAHIAPSIEAKYTRTRLRHHDVLITVVGSVGQVAIVPAGAANWNIARAVALIRPADIKLSRWIALCLRSPFSQHSLNVAANTTVQTTVNLKELKQLAVPMPPTREREEIAATLSALDDRIELLRQTNATLDAIAQTLFKSWFVDFDPVRAKAEGREPDGMDATTATLFPSTFEDDKAIAATPTGWSSSALYDLAQFINGAAYKALAPNAERRGLPIIKIAELKAGVTSQTAFSEVDMPLKYRIDSKDILFSWSGNPDTSIDTFVWSHGAAWLNQHIFRVVPNAPHERSFVLLTLKYLKSTFAEIARDKQTTGLGHVTVADLKRLRVVKPDMPLLKEWNKLVDPLIERAFVTQQQAQSLAQLRDTLLPRLISGKLRLPEAQMLIEEATP